VFYHGPRDVKVPAAQQKRVPQTLSGIPRVYVLSDNSFVTSLLKRSTFLAIFVFFFAFFFAFWIAFWIALSRFVV
tara:strand:- start:152 stop:376 length:225 start_codon:yes stop_codon:yes gene_type:complete